MACQESPIHNRAWLYIILAVGKQSKELFVVLVVIVHIVILLLGTGPTWLDLYCISSVGRHNWDWCRWARARASRLLTTSR
jgi:hypothetical protein